MRGLDGRIGRWAVLAAAGAAWAAAVLAVITDNVPTPFHGLIDCAAVVLSVWALLDHLVARIRVIVEDYRRAEQLIKSSIAEGHGATCELREKPPGGVLRSA